MHKLKKGWTKDKIMKQVRKYNDGTIARRGSELDIGASCRYETPSGNRCAIGCFIPSNHLGLEFIGGVEDLLEKYPELDEYMPFESMHALEMFQLTHDTAFGGKVHAPIKAFLDELCEEHA